MNLPIGFRNLLKNSAKEIRQTSAKSQIPAIRRSATAEFVEDSLSIRKQEAVKLTPVDILHEPVTLEFLGFKSKETWTESDLEEAIIDHMQEFLLEMGNGFCFEARQKRILIDSDYFKADLIFYHRILKCHIIVDIKIDRFRHEYASQMNTYLNYYRYEVMQPDDNPPVGLLLCTGKGDTLVKYATAGLDQNIFVQKYMSSPSGWRFTIKNRGDRVESLAAQAPAYPTLSTSNTCGSGFEPSRLCLRDGGHTPSL